MNDITSFPEEQDESLPVVPGQGKSEQKGEVHACCICGRMFSGFGNNPEPVKKYAEGRCCDDCNRSRVIPTRLARLNKGLDPRG